MSVSSRILTNVRAAVNGIRSEGRGLVFVAIAMGWFLSIGVRLVFPVLIPYARADLGIPLTYAGALLTGLWLAYALGQFPGGLLADKIGERNILVLSTVLAAFGVLLLTLSINLWTLVLGTVIFGFGTAFYGTTRITILTDLYPKNSGTAIGVTLAAGDLGNTILPIVAGFIAATFAWQLGFGFTIPIFVLAGVSLWVLVPRRTSATATEDTSDMNIRESVTQLFGTVFNRTILLGTVIQLLSMFVWQGFTGFYPTYLVEIKGFEPSTASLIFGGFFAFGMGVRMLAGGISDRYGTKRPLLVVMAVLSLSLFSLPFADSLVTILLVTVPLTALLGMGPIIFPYLVSALPEEIQGTGFGLMRTFYMMGAATGPFMVGALADFDLFDEAFIVLSGIILVAWLLVWLIEPGK